MPVSETGSEVCQVGDGFSLTLKYDIVPLEFYGTRPVRASASGIQYVASRSARRKEVANTYVGRIHCQSTSLLRRVRVWTS